MTSLFVVFMCASGRCFSSLLDFTAFRSIDDCSVLACCGNDVTGKKESSEEAYITLAAHASH